LAGTFASAAECPAALPAPVCRKPGKPTKQHACQACRPATAAVVRVEHRLPVSITAAGGRVRICTPAVEAECDRLILQGGSQDRVVLEGSVHVEFHREDRPGAICAESIAVGLRDASYEVNCTGACAGTQAKPSRAGCSGEAVQPASHMEKPCENERDGDSAW